MKFKLFIASVMTGIIGIVVYKAIKDLKPKSETSLTEEEIKEQLEKINNRELQMINLS